MKKIYVLLLLFSITHFGFSQSEVIYKVTFESNWSQATHPHASGNLPGNAHWSKLVGATHNDQITFWELGGIATTGVENIAESGVNTAFENEVNQAIANNNANQYLDGPQLNSALGTVSIENIETNSEYPYLTLLTMIAPSPDWIVGASNIVLLDNNGQWRETINIDLYPIDAGTDSGIDYTSPNNDTNPKEPIADIQGVAPFSNAVMGTLTIELENILNTSNFQDNSFNLFPNPANNEITISAINTIQKITIINSLGAIVTERVVNNQSSIMDITHLITGFYLVEIITENGKRQVKKLIKR